MTDVFRFIDAEKARLLIAFMGRRLGVSQAGYSASRQRRRPAPSPMRG